MRILIDMNLTPRWVQFFRDAGYECSHRVTIGRAETADANICPYARENKSVLLTNDLDFPQILAHTKAALPSVILLRGQPLTPESRVNSSQAAQGRTTRW
jgi:predicted nuclease of predicted toxin-antitoxin system